jgi:hypothetical protein
MADTEAPWQQVCDESARRFGPEFEVVRSLERQRVTPTGPPQAYTYAVFQRVEGGNGLVGRSP